MNQPKITTIATDNPNRFDVKVRTKSGISMFSVKARTPKEAIQRYLDSTFSTQTMSLAYSV